MKTSVRVFYFLSLIVIATLFVWGGNKGFNRVDGIPLIAMLCYFALSKWGASPWFPDILRYSQKAVLVVIAAVFVPLALGHILKHWAMQTHGLDVGFVYSGLFYPYQWPPLWCTVCPNPTYFSEHFSPSLLLVAPITALFGFTEVVLVLQSLLAALVVWSFLYFGPLRNNKSLWFLAILYMVAHRTFRDAMLFDFREDMMALCGFSLMLIALYRQKYFLSLCAFVIGIGAKENMSFLAPFIGSAVFLDHSLPMNRRERFVWACTFTIFGLAWMVLTFKWAIPYFGQGQVEKHVLMSRLPIPGMESSSATSLLGAILENPVAILKYIAQQFADSSRYKYVLVLLLPALPFTYRAWPWLIPAFAGIGMNFISANPTQRMMIFHYDLMILPFLFFALLRGMEKTPLANYNRYTVYMVLWALVLFGRPPMHYIGKYAGDAWTHYKDYSFLSNLKNTDVTAVNMDFLAQVVHLKDTRVFYLPEETCSLESSTFYKAFTDFNQPQNMRSVLPVLDARRFVIDSRDSSENCLADVLHRQFAGHVSETLSPSGRFRVLYINDVSSL